MRIELGGARQCADLQQTQLTTSVPQQQQQHCSGSERVCGDTASSYKCPSRLVCGNSLSCETLGFRSRLTTSVSAAAAALQQQWLRESLLGHCSLLLTLLQKCSSNRLTCGESSKLRFAANSPQVSLQQPCSSSSSNG